MTTKSWYTCDSGRSRHWADTVNLSIYNKEGTIKDKDFDGKAKL